ncbi:HD domain-containing protein [Streptomyces sp. NPDC005322]|uniref:HD domain-containing protein n=1 Tax=unclassified Streptomyces TaxID=2593676 RepID=UPI0033A93884
MSWSETLETLSGVLIKKHFHAHVPAEDKELPQLLDFLGRMDELKHVLRQNPVSDASRRENTAEHSWHVALAALIFSRYAAEPVDPMRCAALAVLHDIVEVVEGDTFVYGPDALTRQRRELQAIDELLAPLPAPERELLESGWHEYEFTETPEGRYVMALDVLLPIFMNLTAGEESSWRRHGVEARAVRRRVDRVKGAVPELARLAYEAIDKGVTRGLLSAP